MSDATLNLDDLQNEAQFYDSVNVYLSGSNHESGMSQKLKHPEVAVYLRVSTDDQDVDAQKRKLRTYLAVDGIDIDQCQLFIDDGVSARDNPTFTDREAGKKMVEAIERGEIQKVFGTYVNRFFRDVAGGSTWIKMMAKKFPHVIIKTTDCFAGHILPEARMIWHTLLMIAEMENEQRSIGTKGGMQAKQERCEKTSSNIFGWEEYDSGQRNYTNGKDVGALIKVRPSWHEQSVRQWMVEANKKLSYNAIAKKLNGWKIPTANGGKWTTSNVMGQIKNPAKMHDQLHQFQKPKAVCNASNGFRNFKPAQRCSKNSQKKLVWRNGDGSQ